MKTPTTTTAANAIAITALYKVAFNRLPDAEGLAWWLNDMEHGQSLHDVAHSFGPLLPKFGTGTVQNILNQFSNNAFGHDASPDVQNHWTSLAYMAVPSYEYVYEAALKLIGQPNDGWAVPVL